MAVKISEIFSDPTPVTQQILWGQITSVTPTFVRIAGDDVSTEIKGHLSSYTPVAGDRVALIRVGTAWLVLGAVV